MLPLLPIHHVGELLEGHKNVLWQLTSEYQRR